MAKIRLDPGQRDGASLFDFIARAVLFVADPVAGIIDGIRGFGQGRASDLPIAKPIVIDTTTNVLTIEYDRALAEEYVRKFGDRYAASRSPIRGIGDWMGMHDEPILNEIWNTGESSRQSQLTLGFRKIVPLLLELRTTDFSPTNAPEVDGGAIVGPSSEEINTFLGLPSIKLGTRMAIGIPPGGMASFSQQVPAVKAALTRGVRGIVGRRRRRAKKKANRAHAKRASSRKKGRKLKFGSPAWQKKYKVGKFRRK